MPAYRFCRSGDIPLLVEAHNTCFQRHFPDVPPMTVDDFKHRVREIDLWASSCMVAHAGGEPIGVLLAAKREGVANRILAVGVRPDHLGQGHGRHMLESLGQKLAILGPRRMLVEVPEDWHDGRRYLEACGYSLDRGYIDFTLTPRDGAGPAVPPGLAELIVPLTVDDLQAANVLDAAADRCWERSREALVKHKDRLRGVALGAGDRIGAWLLVDDRAGLAVREIMALHAPDPDPGRSAALLGALLASFVANDGRPVRFRKVHEGEIEAGVLARLGFEPGARTAGFSAEAGA